MASEKSPLLYKLRRAFPFINMLTGYLITNCYGVFYAFLFLTFGANGNIYTFRLKIKVNFLIAPVVKIYNNSGVNVLEIMFCRKTLLRLLRDNIYLLCRQKIRKKEEKAIY